MISKDQAPLPEILTEWLVLLVEELVNGNIVLEVKKQRPFRVEENLTLEKVLINVDAHINDLLVDIDEKRYYPDTLIQIFLS